MTEPLLETRGLSLCAASPGGDREILKDADLALEPGQTLALTGHSGAGKSLLCRSLLGLLPPGIRRGGDIRWQGRALCAERDWHGVRGTGMTLVLQEPRTALNPVLDVADHLVEIFRVHQGLGGKEVRLAARDLLAEVRLPDPDRTLRAYPHQLSGGMRQRVLLAGALACRPRLLIADEITSALDAELRAGILELVEEIRARRGMALLLVTHDLDLIRSMGYPVRAIDDHRLVPVKTDPPAHTRPPVVEDEGQSPVLVARGLTVEHGARAGRPVTAVRSVDLDLYPGRLIGLAGASGCGKSSLALALARHLDPVTGSVVVEGEDLLRLRGGALRRARRSVQMLFQDPGESLDPRQTVGSCLQEALAQVDGIDPCALLEEVGLEASILPRYPHLLSGGQRQRVALARCLATSPRVLLADEPTSQLDPATTDDVMDLLETLSRLRGLAVLLISHDLALLRSRCTDVHIMLGGVMVEVLPAGEEERHPYTRALLNTGKESHPGISVPALAHTWPGRGGGCPYTDRCGLVTDDCRRGLPAMVTVGDYHQVRCPEVP